MELEALTGLRSASILKQAPVAILITDTVLDPPGPTIRFVNTAFEAMTGWTREEVTGRSPRILQGPNTDRTIFPAMKATLRRGETWHGETINYRKDGSEFIMRWRIAPLTGADGVPAAFMATQEDVTEEKALARRVRKTEAAMAHFVEAAPDAVIVTDGDSRIVRVNRGACDTFGWETEALVGKPVDMLIPPRFRMRHRGKMEALRAGHDTARWMNARREIICLHRDGREFPAMASLVRSAEGDGFAVILRDLTEQKETEMALRKAYETAEAANTAKSKFLSLMGHEFRTPLNAINGFSDFIAQELLGPVGSPKYREYAGHIRESGERLLRLIEGLLDVSRLEDNKFELWEEVFDLGALLTDMVHGARIEAQHRHVALQLDPPPTIFVNADPHLIRQAGLNLVRNAVKFSPPGATVRMTMAPTEDGGVRIVVLDDGPGMAPEDLRRVTLPFVQLNANRDLSHEGSGIGLFLTKSFIELHKGTLTLTSPKTGGTIAILWLPPDCLTGWPQAENSFSAERPVAVESR